MANIDDTRRFDIVRKENERAMFWLEGVADLPAAKLRIAELLSFWPGVYQVFDLSTKKIVWDSAAVIVEEDSEISAMQHL
jgi:hypothetical protein